MKTNLTNPLYSIDRETDKVKDLKKTLEQKLHEAGSIIYPAIAYDSYWIASQSLYKNHTFNSGNENLAKSFKQIIVNTVKSYNGLSGNIKLNKSGDW
jgi:hypothetical protein